MIYKTKEITYMTFLELANKRYSARKYKDQPIEKEKLDQVLEAGRIAPTAKNNQPSKSMFYKVKKPSKRFLPSHHVHSMHHVYSCLHMMKL